MSNGKAPRPTPYQFHPLEISILGYSGSGKTTLIEKLFAALASEWDLAYVKHDAHGFQVDREGKDTFRASAAGASSSYISNDQAFAWMGRGKISLFQQRSLFLDNDAVLVEGYKSLDMDKIVVIDAEGKILDQLPEESWDRIRAFVGPGAIPKHKLPIERPYFSRDAIGDIATFIKGFWRQKMDARTLHGLVLAGGMSSRMGQDKGRLKYGDKPQALEAVDLLESFGLPTFLSLRDGQWPKEQTHALKIIPDQFQGLGPLGGILSAMQQDPHSAWLVLACDLPLLRPDTIEQLLASRQPQKMATAYRSTRDGMPEPLCAIYEPMIRMRMFEALGLGLSCPRKILLNTPIRILEPRDPLALTNANSPEDFLMIKSQLSQKEISL